MKTSEVKSRLYALGYLSRKRDPLAPAVKRFQKDQGLKADGIVGPQTARALHDPLLGFCGVREHITTSNGLCKWGLQTITWHIAGSLRPRISDADFKAAFHEAFGYWAAVCGIEPSYTANAKTANVLVGTGRIDGSGSTLAWSELPCGSARQLKQQYDIGETFVISETPARAQIDLVRVAAHEIGHVIGLPHLSDRGALLAPMYNPNVRRPQRSDIEQAVKRYGPPKKPTPPPPSPDSAKWSETPWFPLPFTDVEMKLRQPILPLARLWC